MFQKLHTQETLPQPCKSSTSSHRVKSFLWAALIFLQNCEFRLRGHYHCLKPGCTFVTIGTSKLPWHMKKHEKIAKREASGFKYYTKKDNCRYPGLLECCLVYWKNGNCSFWMTDKPMQLRTVDPCLHADGLIVKTRAFRTQYRALVTAYQRVFTLKSSS